ncbi:MAG TPA: LamG-like jellyroll fold domain-containing protein, partial [Chitinophagales bacterium]|nr:LamG-like jellyroll fold domain-containing protein [Chitinophagales bacterium]
NGGAQPGGSGYGGGARGTGLAGQGNSGSWGAGYWYPGGGGGAGGSGSTNPAHGGIGIQCAITGTNYYWAGGGGGGSGGGGSNATGGSGINAGANGTAACAGCWAQVPGGNGGANTGGGGGGGSHYNASNNGGNGGSGIVVVRYMEGTWSSSNTAVATVNASGVVTGVSAGTATITYTVGSGACVATSSRTVTIGAPAVPQAVGNITLGPIPSINGATILPDANITASTCHPGNANSCNTSGGDGHESWRGRLFNSSAGVQGWASTSPFTGCWWQADLGSVRPVNGISSQIRGDCCPDQRMGSYTVKTSIDGVTWFDVPGTFNGNPTNGDYTVVTNWFGQYNARYVRVYPITWGGHLTTRIEVHSIPEGSSASAQTVYASAEISSGSNTVRWWDAASGGSLLATGQFAGFNITANTTVYAEGYNSSTGCASSSRTPVLLRINDIYGAGPAGVGNTNSKSDLNLWLNADALGLANGAAVSSWTDQSGTGNHMVQYNGGNPTYITNSLNSRPIVRYDGNNYTYTPTNFNNPYTILTVSKNTGSSRFISSVNVNWLLGTWGGTKDVMHTDGWVTYPGTGIDANAYIWSSYGNSRATRFFKNGADITGNQTGGLSAPGQLSIGGWSSGSEKSPGDAAEIVLFKNVLNAARQNIVENYLAAKYGLANSNDVYAGDIAGNGECDFDVAGIGRESSGIHEQTRSGGLYLTNSAFPGFLQNNGDYLMIGRTSSTTAWETSDLTACASPAITRRLSRIWYFSKTDVGGNGGNVTLRFSFDDLGLGTPAAGTYHLISRAANSGSFTSVTTGTISGNGINFTINASSLSNGQYTLGYESETPRALTFSAPSAQYVTVPASASITSGSVATVEAWINPLATQYDATYNGILSVGPRSTCSNSLLLSINSSLVPTMASWCADITNGTVPLTANVWNHLAVVVNGTSVNFYINGNLTQSATLSATPNFLTGQLNIGCTDNPGRHFNGKIDEVRVWNTALSQAQIQARMHANITNSDALWNNLTAYYKLNEGAGTNVWDLSKNNNNGTLVNGPSVTSLYTAGPSISGTTTVCQNTTNTYTLATTNPNTRLVYNWSVAGGTINSGQGTASISVTWTSAGSQSVNCTVTHSNECQTETATLPVTVQAPSNAGTVVQTPASGSHVCAGANVNYTTSGTTGTFNYFEYQWNTTAGAYSGSWITSNPGNWTSGLNGASILYVRAVYTNGVCPAAVSAPVNVTVDAPSVAGTVTQTPASGTSVCDGANVNYSYSGGTGTFNYFEYQWNTTAGAYSGSWIATNPGNWTAGLNGASVLYVRAVATSGVCPSAVSAPVNVTVNPNQPVSVSIAQSPLGTICAGTNVTFTATPVNGGGSPAYQWKKNGNNVGSNSASYSDAGLNNGDVITCVLTSNATCATSSPATSNAISMTVNPNLPVSVTIGASPAGAVCSGTNVTFTATPTNGGSTPVYQWKKNGNNVGTNSTTYSDAGLVSGDVITCVLTSNAACATGSPATSNAISATVHPPSVGGNVFSSQTICYNTPMADVGLVGQTGNVIKWQKSNDNFVGNVVDIASTSSVLTGASQGNLTSDTWFRAVVQSGAGCATANSGTVKITVAPAASGGTLATAQTICAGVQMADLSLSGYVGGIVKWQKSSDNFSSNIVDIANTSATLTGASQGALTQDTWYRVVVQSGGGCPEALSTVVKITVNPTPNVSNFGVASGPICAGGVATVTVNSTSLVAGTYTVAYTLTGANAANGLTASVVMSGNTGSFSTGVLNSTGTTTITVNSVQNASGCSAPVTTNNTASVVITSGPSVSI